MLTPPRVNPATNESGVGDTANVRVPGILPYQRVWIRGDVFAGLAAGAVVIPQAMAFATVANMPVQFGLYSCKLPTIAAIIENINEATLLVIKAGAVAPHTGPVSGRRGR
jgi:Sulfate permease family